MRFLLSALVVLASVFFVAKRTSRDSPAESLKEKPLKGLDAPLKEVSPEKVAALPAPVRKWMEWSGVAGREEIRSIYAKQIGRMKLKPGQEKWMASEAWQYTIAEPPGFIWKVKMKMGNGLFATGKDEFQEGKAQMRIKIGGLFPIANTCNNPKADQSSMQRYLMELSSFPSAALSRYVEWKAIDAHTAEAVMAYNWIIGRATFHFGADGELRKVTAMRFKDSGEEAELLPCTAHIRNYQTVDGIRLPSEIAVTWELAEGPFTWYEFTMQEVAFNVAKPEGF